MKVGKTIKTIKAPKREIRKAKEAERPIPVYIPQKEPAKAEWVYQWRFAYGLDKGIMKDKTIFINGVF